MSQAIASYDRNLSNNVIDINSTYEEDAPLIKNMIAFFCYDITNNFLKEDIWGKKVLDPKVFAQKMHYKNYRSLINKHPEASHLKDLKKRKSRQLRDAEEKSKDIVLFDTYFCNALYRMRYEEIKFTRPGKTPTGMNFTVLEGIKILKSVKKLENTARNKLYYEIEYDEAFMNNIARYFLTMDAAVYAQLRKPRLQDLYMFLINERSSMARNKASGEEITSNRTSFDKLCELADINRKTPAEKKRTLNEAFDRINDIVGEEIFILKWLKNGRYYYRPEIAFRYASYETAAGKYGSELKLATFMHHNLLGIFRERYSIENEKQEEEYQLEYCKWLLDDQTDMKIKVEAFAKAHELCFAKPIDVHSEQARSRTKKTCMIIIEEIINAVIEPKE